MPLDTSPRDDPEHDPGTDVAGRRAAALSERPPAPLRIPHRAAGGIIVGTASWTDPTMTAAGVFYPDDVHTPEERLRYYASRFPVVEIDSPYYALPTRRNAELWLERTPTDFTFDVKAHALMTGQPSEPNRLPKALRDALPGELATRRTVYARELRPEIVDAVWSTFRDALEPLHAAGKLGAVLLQYPRWFLPSPESRDRMIEARHRLEGFPIAVELRNRRWYAPRVLPRLLEVLRGEGIPLVSVDAPQGHESSVPDVVETTSPHLAVVRLHGRRSDTWQKRGVPVVERFRYLYDREQLESWVPRIVEIAERTRWTHVVFNNCYGNYGTTNAREMTELLARALDR